MDTGQSKHVPECWLIYVRLLTDLFFLVVEFDTPENLINKTDGVFREMCVKTGSFEELRAAATKSSPSAW